MAMVMTKASARIVSAAAAGVIAAAAISVPTARTLMPKALHRHKVAKAAMSRRVSRNNDTLSLVNHGTTRPRVAPAPA
jgi:hypothetical protein